jgi:hypothetical protein
LPHTLLAEEIALHAFTEDSLGLTRNRVWELAVSHATLAECMAQFPQEFLATLCGQELGIDAVF